MEKRELVIRPEMQKRAIQLIGEIGIKNLKVSPRSIAKMLEKYGEGATTTYLMIKWEEINPSISKIEGLLKLGLSFDEVITIYLTREKIQEIASVTHQRCGVSLVQLTRLIEQFPDFKEMETDEQVEIILDMIKLFGWKNSFRDTVTAITEKAKELNISDIFEFIEIIEDLASGDIHENFFHNWERD